MNRLGLLAARRGDLEAAERWYRPAVDVGDDIGAFNLESLLGETAGGSRRGTGTTASVTPPGIAGEWMGLRLVRRRGSGR
jgi:hypothetical protein